MTLMAHQQRVLHERDELLQKLERLRTFIGSQSFEAVPPEEQSLMLEQALHMTDYAWSLTRRINLWTEAPCPSGAR